MKPWFAGKLDFAPVVAFGGDAEFPLQGVAAEYFLDRTAAAERRLHPRDEPLPAGETEDPQGAHRDQREDQMVPK